MKKSLLFLFFGLFLITSCNREEDVKPNIRPTLKLEKLIGDWPFYSITVTTTATGKTDYITPVVTVSIPQTDYEVEYHTYTFIDGTAIKNDLQKQQTRISYRIKDNTVILSNGIIFNYVQETETVASLNIVEKTQFSTIKYEYRK